MLMREGPNMGRLRLPSGEFHVPISGMVRETRMQKFCFRFELWLVLCVLCRVIVSGGMSADCGETSLSVIPLGTGGAG
jgi:hypothetical protein